MARGVKRGGSSAGRRGGAAVGLAAGMVWASAWGALPPVPVPPENPITEPKRVLGKILFWDEQLSTSNVVSCGTCHSPARAGADDRLARAPGLDGVANTPDDVFGSPGVIRSDEGNDYERDATFALGPQITGRAANSPINAAYAPLLFWDGRAPSRFADPITGATVIASGGALESQAVAPILNNVEMAHAGATWDGVSAKLTRVRPLALSTSIPPDVAPALAGGARYEDLFAAAFGDGSITPARIAMAIATYQRTLISDQTPFDRFRAGDTAALTAQQVRGFNEFERHSCVACHSTAGDLFTDFSFRNIGLRPIAEDRGRQNVTGNPGDRGKFKVPSLRNVGLKRTFMHNGQFQSLTQVIQFYARAPVAPPQFPDNRDPLMNAIVPLPAQDAADIQNFLQNGLTDPRVAGQLFPFDRPTLFVDRPADQGQPLPGGTPGSGGIVPRIIVQAPAMVGNLWYRVGLDGALGGARARLGVSTQAPVGGLITPEWFHDAVNADGTGQGAGVATTDWTLDPKTTTPDQVVWLQWFVDDPAAPGGQARSNAARVRFFCGSSGCPGPCDMIDLNHDQGVDISDLLAFLEMLDAGNLAADLDNDGDAARAQLDGSVDISDLLFFLGRFAEGC